MKIIVWFLSLLIFSWCYSTFFSCLFNLKLAKIIKISLFLYLGIISALYLISYFFIHKYFNDILICSIISAILSFFTAKNMN